MKKGRSRKTLKFKKTSTIFMCICLLVLLSGNVSVAELVPTEFVNSGPYPISSIKVDDKWHMQLPSYVPMFFSTWIWGLSPDYQHKIYYEALTPCPNAYNDCYSPISWTIRHFEANGTVYLPNPGLRDTLPNKGWYAKYFDWDLLTNVYSILNFRHDGTVLWEIRDHADPTIVLEISDQPYQEKQGIDTWNIIRSGIIKQSGRPIDLEFFEYEQKLRLANDDGMIHIKEIDQGLLDQLVGQACGQGGEMLYDCDLECVHEAVRNYIGNGACDEGIPYGVNLNCGQFEFDGGDCSE